MRDQYLGRLFDQAESAAMEPAVVLGYRAWQRHFGGRPDVIGERVVVDSIFNMGPPRGTYTVVGVMAEDFEFPSEEAQFWVPLNIERSGGVASIARLRDDATLDAAQREVTAILSRLRGEDRVGRGEADAPAVELVSLQEEMVAPGTACPLCAGGGGRRAVADCVRECCQPPRRP